MRLKLKAHCECDDIIRIGRVVENEVTEVEFDFSQWQEEYGAGIATLLVLRNHDANPYPVVLSIEDGKALWTITDADTAVFGRGCFQLKYVAGAKVKMSKIFQFNCGKSLTGEGDAPDPYENWLDTLTDLTAETQTNAQAAQASAESASASAEAAQQSAEEAEEIRQSIVDNRSDWAEDDSDSLKYIDNRPAVRAGTGTGAVVEGEISGDNANVASGEKSHAEGCGGTVASGRGAHAEGSGTNASRYYTHAEGFKTSAIQHYAHAEGTGTIASGISAHAEGGNTLAKGICSHAEGLYTIARQRAQHAEGMFNIEDTEGTMSTHGKYLHIVGNGTDEDNRSNAHTLDWDGNAWYAGNVSVEGTPTNDKDLVTKAWTTDLVREGVNTACSGVYSEMMSHEVTPLKGRVDDLEAKTVQDDWNEADSNSNAYIQNKPSIASGDGVDSVIEGCITGTNANVASKNCSHAEGFKTEASGVYSHAEGARTKSSSEASHSEGLNTIASGNCSHAESSGTKANGYASHSEGIVTIASSTAQHVQGQYNIEDSNNTYAHIVGNGTANDARSNAHTLDWSGNAWYAGKVTAEGTPTESNDLVPKSYADKFLNAFPIDTASGAVASFSDGAELPLKSLIIDINPVQDTSQSDPSPTNICPISGWDEVNVVACGVNVWDEEWELGYIDGTTGQPTTQSTSIRSKNFNLCIPNASYYGCFPALSGSALYLYWYDADENFISRSSVSNTAKTAPSNARYFKMACYHYGTTYNHDISINYPSIDHDYYAYSGQNITIPFGQTVYGGVLDVLSGKLTIDRAMLDMSTLSWFFRNDTNRAFTFDIKNLIKIPSSQALTSGSIAEKYTEIRVNATLAIGEYAIMPNGAIVLYYDGVNAPSGKLVYPLATPIEIQLDPHSLESLYGDNNIYADTGDTSVEYRADPTMYIQRKIAEAISALT